MRKKVEGEEMEIMNRVNLRGERDKVIVEVDSWIQRSFIKI